MFPWHHQLNLWASSSSNTGHFFWTSSPFLELGGGLSFTFFSTPIEADWSACYTSWFPMRKSINTCHNLKSPLAHHRWIGPQNFLHHSFHTWTKMLHSCPTSSCPGRRPRGCRQAVGQPRNAWLWGRGGTAPWTSPPPGTACQPLRVATAQPPCGPSPGSRCCTSRHSGSTPYPLPTATPLK